MRRHAILKGITKTMRGMEIAPWFAPLAPKNEGFNCLVVDVFDKPTLLALAEKDANVPRDGIPLIEEVDFVGSAVDIAELVPSSMHGTFDYIISSHNFEHLPDPIKFLQGCQTVLKPGGMLSMVVPDMRACFDVFRPHTTVIDWLLAFKEKRSRPSPEQVFQSHGYWAALMQNGSAISSFPLHKSLNDIEVIGDIGVQYQKWRASAETDGYVDAHCTVMTPASLELLILECQHLGLVSMEVESVSETAGIEFNVRLRNSKGHEPVQEINVARTALLRRMLEERFFVRSPFKYSLRALARKVWNWRKITGVNYSLKRTLPTLPQ